MPVQIIAHRGWWETPEEQNTLAAFARAFDAGLGVELDVRDSGGLLVVSHDPPQYRLDSTHKVVGPGFFQSVIDLLGSRPLPLAVNVKSCGLAPWFAHIDPKPANWFFFDAAPGDDIEYPRHNLPLYVRDQWKADPILLVSWEILFHEDPTGFWTTLRDSGNAERENILLITDRPRECMEFFK